ncbi:MAG: hypothetical protein K6C10_00130 [Prevotella sp.]|nr:hypothetical protein [Prevotella sp.]
MKRAQNRIAESRSTLTIVAILGALVACAIGAVGMGLGDAFYKSVEWWGLTAILAISTALIVEINNSNSLIRIYSRLVSCSFLILTLMATFLYPLWREAIVGLLFIVAYLFLLRSYQDKTAVGSIYGVFCALSTSSIFFVQMFYFVPLFWLLMGIRMNSLSWRTFFASLLGIITPYWLIGGYFLYTQDYLTPMRHFMALGQFMPLEQVFSLNGPLVAPFFTDPVLLYTPRGSVLAPIFTLIFLLLLTLIGMIHFLRQSSRDKLRTQMIYEMFIIVTFAIIVFIALQPQHLNFQLKLLIVNTSMFIGHYLALTNTKLTNIMFFVILFLTMALTGYNLYFS